MNFTTVSSILMVFISLCILASLRSRNDPQQSALTYVTNFVAAMLVGLACCLNAAIVGFDAALRAFWSAAVAEYKARWNHIAAAPGRTEVAG
jgi:putative Mn2+ efflux pump MntP